MKRLSNSRSGPTPHRTFSLVEVIAVLVLATIVRGYQWSADNAHLVQKAQVAMTRIAVELSASDTPVTTTAHSFTVGQTTVGRAGNQAVLRVATGGAALTDGSVLVDSVTSFSVSESGGIVTVTLGLTGANAAEQTFQVSTATP
jgi:hypothetical protein